MKLKKEDIQAIASRELVKSRGYEDDEISGNRQRAMDYYLGRRRGDETVGNATVQSLDVQDAVNATSATLSPMMKATLVEFVPDSEEDEPEAQLESDFCMYIADKSNAYREFSNAAFDALLQANGWLKVYVDEDLKTWEREYEGLPEIAVAEAVEPSCPGDVVEIVSKSQEDGLYNLTVRHSVNSKRLVIKAVPPEYMLFAPSHMSMDLQDIRFIAERKLMMRSELIEMGLDKTLVMELPHINTENWQSAYQRQLGVDMRVSGEQDATEVVECFECYMQLDVEGKGETSLYRVWLAGHGGSTLLDYEKARFIPYCTGSALPMPHRLTGLSMYDLLKEVQDTKTPILRQWLDNHRNANQSRVGAVEGQVNMQDLVSPRPGGAVRMRSPDAVVPLGFNDVGPSCQNALAYMDQVRSERAGAAIDMNAGEMQIAGASATAAANEYSNKERMSAFYCRNVVESLVRGAYLLIHEALRTYFDEDMSAKLRGKWAQTNPRKWVPRRNVRVVGGLSDSERRDKLNGYNALIQYQTMAMQAGLSGELVNGDGIYAALADWQRMANLGEVEEYWVNPGSDEARQAAQAKQQQAQEQAKQQEALQKRMFDQEQQLKRYMHDSELRFKYYDAQLDAEVKEAEMVADATLELEKQAMPQQEANNG